MTAVEDMLQDDVSECIQDFIKAGIKVWMLTGDKGETALEIGLLCGLYKKDSENTALMHIKEVKYDSEMEA